MKSIEKEVHNDTVVALETRNFGIEKNAKAFKVLISSIYSDKIRSITREIWSNAFDSHTVAGKSHEPFEITLPTLADPVFRVKDFGVGLSKEQVFDIYTILFKSTKDLDNVGVGKYGIGSKTPFAYADAFSIISTYDGQRTYYSATISSVSEPRIHVMAEEKTEDENGLTVEFAVHNRDIDEFHVAAKKVGIGFDLKPIVTNDSSFKWEYIGKEIYPNIFFRPSNDYEYGGISRKGVFAKMGCVIYPFDIELIEQKLKKFSADTDEDAQIVNSTTAFIKDMLKMSSLGEIIFNFPIGDLEPSASREQLSYGDDEPTVGSFIEFVQEFVSHIEEEMIEISHEHFYLDACKKFAELSSKFNMLPNTVNRALVPHFRSAKAIKSIIDVAEISANPIHRFNSFTKTDTTFALQRGTNTISLRHRNFHATTIADTTKTMLLMISSDRKDQLSSKTHFSSLSNRIGRFVKANDIKNVFVIEVRNNFDQHFIYNVMDIFEGAHIVHASELPILPSDNPEKEKKKAENKVSVATNNSSVHMQIGIAYEPLNTIIEKYGKDKIAVVRAEYPGQNLNRTLKISEKLLTKLINPYIDWYKAAILVNHSAKSFASKHGLTEVKLSEIVVSADMLSEKGREVYQIYRNNQALSYSNVTYLQYYKAILQKTTKFPQQILDDLSEIEITKTNLGSTIERLMAGIYMSDKSPRAIGQKFDEAAFLKKHPIFAEFLKYTEVISGRYNISSSIGHMGKHLINLYGETKE